MEPKYRDRAPRMFMDTDGKERLNVDGKINGGPRGLGRLGGIGLRDGRVPEDLKYEAGRKGGFDPHERIKDLDLDGIDAAFLYPSVGLFSGAIRNPRTTSNAACWRAALWRCTVSIISIACNSSTPRPQSVMGCGHF
jgi:hypothetical protein